MCSIIASFNREKFEELIKLNQHRGNFSFSYTELDTTIGNLPANQIKGYGEFEKLLINSERHLYKIGHVQAPTNGMIEDSNRIHPIMNGESPNSMLFHNGLLTPRGVKFLQHKLQTNETFDTRLLFEAIKEFGYDILDEVEGLFSCLHIRDGEIFIFRTKHGKLFIDEDMNVSSERFLGSKCIGYNRIYKLDLDKKHIISKQPFITKRFNFVIKGEL